MPSTILSDNGVSSGSAGLKTTASNDGILVLQTTTSGGTATNAVTVDNLQNVGLGTTPSAWGSAIKGIQITAGSGYVGTASFTGGFNSTYVFQNAYYDGTFFKYVGSTFATQYQQVDGIHRWYSAPSGTAGNNITFTQTLAIEKDKSLALQGASSQTGTGITFPATQSASSNANTLDDYEEGTFTPVVIGETVPGTASYSSQVGTYTKIGRVVSIQIFLNWTGGTGSGNLRIGGLPFTSEGTVGNYAISSGYCSNINLSAGNVFYFAIGPNSTAGGIDQYPSGGGAATNVTYDGSGGFGISISYQTA